MIIVFRSDGSDTPGTGGTNDVRYSRVEIPDLVNCALLTLVQDTVAGKKGLLMTLFLM